jgi:type IV secretory pathway VirB10-like protein
LLTKQATTSPAGLLLARSSAILERMNRRIASVAGLAALALLLSAASACADEIKLKDGSKINGTIVGFEDNSFKVKTSYGFAVVQKDQVVSITVTDAAKQPEPDSAKKPDSVTAKKSDAEAVKRPERAAAKTPVAAPAPKSEKVEHASAPPASATPTTTPQAKTQESQSAASADDSVVEYPHTDAATTSTKNSAQPTPAASSASTASGASTPAAAPEPMREEVSGNLYTNDTYGFRMYKPPTWKLIEGARTILPGSITALGTDDQNTYLLIGQEPSGKSLANDIAATEQRLHEVMENFRPLGEKQVMISGVSATERRFRGSVDARDWSGIVVYIPHGTRVYTIFGMTLADTDLVQIQENVISRAITSLQFTK